MIDHDVGQHLFIFGFETPEMVRANHEHGTDFEDSEAVYIEAATRSEALAWGRKMATDFFDALFRAETEKLGVDDYAHWIEQEPETRFASESLKDIPSVKARREEPSAIVVAAWLAGT